MTAKILNGKQLADNLIAELKHKVNQRQAASLAQPTLAVVLVGENPASQVYVRNKKRACETAGMRSIAYDLPATTTELELLDLIDTLREGMIEF